MTEPIKDDLSLIPRDIELKVAKNNKKNYIEVLCIMMLRYITNIKKYFSAKHVLTKTYHD
jgi:hypothetical protein